MKTPDNKEIRQEWQQKPPRSPLRKALLARLCCCFVFSSGCAASQPKIPVRASFHGYPIETTVDDERAKLYLEDYLQGKPVPAQLQQKFASLDTENLNQLPTRETLQKISAEFSLDFGALFFMNRLLKQPGNPELNRRYQQHLENVRNAKADFKKRDILILLVPGFDYVENGHITGADFKKPRALLEQAGYEVLFVDIDPIGSVEENAAYLTAKIAEHRRRKIVIAGASSAGPAIHLALGQTANRDDLANVKAWLNLGGILQGVPVLDQFSSGPKGWLLSTIIWFKGWKKHSFESMRTAVSRQRFAALAVPRHIQIYNYLGLSLSGDISKFASDKYAMMQGDGPNDGLTLLTDAIAPNSFTVLSPKTDHFFAQDPEIDKKTLALLLTIMERIR
jgi:hypothetical protein